MPVFRGRMLAGCLLAVATLCSTVGCAAAAEGDAGAKTSKPAAKKVAHKTSLPNPFPRARKVADDFFDGGNGWLNVSGPIEFSDLRGKVVVIDFWTFCCINCMHVLPDLKYLEHKYPKELVVIGVHSAKFENEKDSENIRRAIMRYDIEHPVVNDSQMAIWQKAGVNSWPTLAVIDPEGKFIKAFSGEGKREALDNVIGRLVTYHKANGTLDLSPLALGLERHKLPATPLRFPGKVLADEASGRLFIADSGHNRIVICTLGGKLIDVAGTGEVGKTNGSFSKATFHHPQGLALRGSKLYVADTENHLIRILDLEKKTVSTLAGTGKQASWGAAGGAVHQAELNSPWDLCLVNHTLYVAMAGSHQIWSHGLGTGLIHNFAGTGREDIQNGSRTEAAFAQPSGLATDGKTLFVSDSEGSAIRAVPLGHGGPVTTIAGTSDLSNGRSLFEFGDIDGAGSNARLQHPLGLAYDDGKVFVADTYNHKIKAIDASTGNTKTWLGSGKRGDGVDPAEFAEPGGLSVAGASLYIADTNNHVIKVADLKTKQVKKLDIEGLSPPEPHAPKGDAEVAYAGSAAAPRTESQRVTAGDALRIEFALKLPAGYKLNKLAPVRCKLGTQQPTELFAASVLAKSHSAEVEEGRAVVSVPLAAKTGKADLDVSLSFNYCRDGVGGLCKLGRLKWSVPVEIAADAKQNGVHLSAEVGEN